MGNQRDRQFTLPKNIRQMGRLGDTYKIYVEDFVYTYVHRTLHMEKQEHEIAAAVLLGKTCRRNNQEYIFISGAQQVSFSEWGQVDEIDSMHRFTENDMIVLKSDAESNPESNAEPDTESDICKEDAVCQKEDIMYDVPVSAIVSQERQQQFWEKVYQGIKEYFSDLELLGWYFNLDGDNLEISASMQQFFDATEEHGSKFLYFEDKLNRQDAFFVQEQHSLQRVEGYAVYYEKNPSMQEFLVAQNRHTEPPRVEGEAVSVKREDVAQNYRAILNKLNEKPAKKKRQPFVYVAGVAVLAVVAATGITQVGNYQNLKTLQQTLQTVWEMCRENGRIQRILLLRLKKKQQKQEMRKPQSRLPMNPLMENSRWMDRIQLSPVRTVMRRRQRQKMYQESTGQIRILTQTQIRAQIRIPIRRQIRTLRRIQTQRQVRIRKIRVLRIRTHSHSRLRLRMYGTTL